MASIVCFVVVFPRLPIGLDDFSTPVDSNLPGKTSVFTYSNLRIVSVEGLQATYNLVR